MSHFTLNTKKMIWSSIICLTNPVPYVSISYDDNPNWVHVSYVSDVSNRNRCLKAYKEKRSTKYAVI